MITDTSFKESINIVELAQSHAQLRKVSGKEFAGPCPLCGGDDRFHATPEWFFCRQCHPKRGDAIDMTRWLHGVEFRQACEMLTNGEMPALPSNIHFPVKKTTMPSTSTGWKEDSWQQSATKECYSSHDTLFESSVGEQGREYLSNRGLDAESWQAFCLGFNPSTPVPGSKDKAPAVVIPWVIGGTLRGIRYRFLGPQSRVKSSSYKGSRFASSLFGGHAMEKGVPEKRTLVICEGELNAISIWQVANGTNLDVLSMGSESAKLTQPMIDYAKRYASVIVWADEDVIAKGIMSFIPNSHGITSPGGKDANDMLKGGSLGRYLSVVRYKCSDSDSHKEVLLWSLWDRYQSPRGIDAGTENVMHQIADRLGRKI